MITEGKQTLTYNGAKTGGGDRIVSTVTYRNEKEKAKRTNGADIANLRRLIQDWMATGTSSIFELKFQTVYGRLYVIEVSKKVHAIFFVTQSNAGGKLYTFDRLFTDYPNYQKYLDSMRKNQP